MSNYIRVIPRDLFNEANLLKCLGALYIALENAGAHRAQYEAEAVNRFDIRQNEDDGSIYVANLPFSIAGRTYHLSRPLNSRQPWPLWLSDFEDPDFEPIQVFEDDGHLSVDFLALIRPPATEGDS